MKKIKLFFISTFISTVGIFMGLFLSTLIFPDIDLFGFVFSIL